VLIEQHQLINDDRAQREQLRALQALHRHLRAPLKNGLEQAIERFNGLRTQFMEDTPYFHAIIVVRGGPTPGCHQGPLACSHRLRTSGALEWVSLRM
jgi:hypothetical protein